MLKDGICPFAAIMLSKLVEYCKDIVFESSDDYYLMAFKLALELKYSRRAWCLGLPRMTFHGVLQSCG
jgi:hypothetical protein